MYSSQIVFKKFSRLFEAQKQYRDFGRCLSGKGILFFLFGTVFYDSEIFSNVIRWSKTFPFIFQKQERGLLLYFGTKGESCQKSSWITEEPAIQDKVSDKVIFLRKK